MLRRLKYSSNTFRASCSVMLPSLLMSNREKAIFAIITSFSVSKWTNSAWCTKKPTSNLVLFVYEPAIYIICQRYNVMKSTLKQTCSLEAIFVFAWKFRNSHQSIVPLPSVSTNRNSRSNCLRSSSVTWRPYCFFLYSMNSSNVICPPVKRS